MADNSQQREAQEEMRKNKKAKQLSLCPIEKVRSLLWASMFLSLRDSFPYAIRNIEVLLATRKMQLPEGYNIISVCLKDILSSG